MTARERKQVRRAAEMNEELRDPYYSIDGDDLVLKAPWHYIFFCQFRWYRRLIGGIWEHVHIGGCSLWMRMKP